MYACAAAAGGENGRNRVMNGSAWRIETLLQSPFTMGRQVFVQQQRASSASDLNLVVRFQGRQLRYLESNACTEYEDESDV
jgi:hypothetical protein